MGRILNTSRRPIKWTSQATALRWQVQATAQIILSRPARVVATRRRVILQWQQCKCNSSSKCNSNSSSYCNSNCNSSSNSHNSSYSFLNRTVLQVQIFPSRQAPVLATRRRVIIQWRHSKRHSSSNSSYSLLNRAVSMNRIWRIL